MSGGIEIEPGDFLSFRLGDVFPADDQLSEWLILLAMAFNDLSLVHDRLERDYDTPYAYLYWLRLGVSHFTEAAKFLEKTRGTPEVRKYIDSLPEEVQRRYDECLAIFNEHRRELIRIRDTLFHYLTVVHGKPEVARAISTLADEKVSLKTGTIRDARLLFADDILAALFARSTGVPWEDVRKDEVQEHVGAVQLRIQEAVTAFMRFVNPALTEPISRAMEAGVAFSKVEPVDPGDWRKGWKVVGN